MKTKILISLLAILTISVSYVVGGAKFIEMITGYGAFYSLCYGAIYCFRSLSSKMILKYLSLFALAPTAIAYFMYLSCDPARFYPHTMATLFNLTEVLMSIFIIKITGIVSGAKKEK